MLSDPTVLNVSNGSNMFTGIVTDIGEVIAMHPAGEGLHRLKIACGYDRATIADGASIACSGVLPHCGRHRRG